MKRCARCGCIKPAHEFTKHRGRPDGKQAYCNPCQRAAVRAHYAAHREYYLAKAERQNAAMARYYEEVVRALKTVPCARCGETYPPAAMHFDHVRGEKLFNIGNGARRTVAQMQGEILKCEVHCANCHMDRTVRPRLVEADRWLERWPDEILWRAP